MKKLVSILLAALMLLAFAACGAEKPQQPVASGAEGGSGSGGGGESQSEERQAPLPSGEGAAYELLDLRFYLPTAFIPSKINNNTGNQRYFTVDDGVGSGTVITVMRHDAPENLDHGDWAATQALAAISRTKMYSNGVNGEEWFTGEWVAGSLDKYYFVGAHGKYIYEFSIEKGDDNFLPAIEMLKETLWFA